MALAVPSSASWDATRDPEVIATGPTCRSSGSSTLMSWGRDHVSLDTPVDEDGDTSLGDLMAQETAPGPDDTVLDVEARERLDSLVGQLDDRAADIIRARYGLARRPPAQARRHRRPPRHLRRARAPARAGGAAEAAPPRRPRPGRLSEGFGRAKSGRTAGAACPSGASGQIREDLRHTLAEVFGVPALSMTCVAAASRSSRDA